MRVRAIDELTAKEAKLSSIDRIELGNKYDVPQWLPEAYADVFVRESHLAAEEGEKLGLEITVKILEGRDRCKKNGWSHSDDNNVIQLANEIFPPPNRAVAPRRRGGRFAGRLVYGVSRTSPNLSMSCGVTLTFSSLRGRRKRKKLDGIWLEQLGSGRT